MKINHFGRTVLVTVSVAALASSFSLAQSLLPSPASSSSPSPSPTNTSAASAVGLQVGTNQFGSFLTDNQGRSLYLFEADTSEKSTCYGQCSQVWPPFIASEGQDVQGSTGVDSSLISTSDRDDGTKQVTYQGKSLYYYSPDQAPGDTKGQGINSFGAAWYLVKPDGSALQSVRSNSGSGTGAGNGSGTGAGNGTGNVGSTS